MTIQQAIDLSVQHHNAGYLPKVEGIYQQILEAEPNQPVVLRLLGTIALQVGKHDIAVDLIGKALAINPDDAEAHTNLGAVLKKQGKLDDAVASYHKALAINPDYGEAHCNLGVALQKQGKLDDAVASYRKAMSIKPNYVEVHFSLGTALKEQGKLDDAVASYRKALAIKSVYAEAHINLASNLWISLGRALRDVAYNNSQTVVQETSCANWNKKLDNPLINDKLWDEMLICADRGLSLTPSDTGGLSLKASVLLGLNRNDDWAALCDFDRLIQTQTMSTPEGYSDLKTFNETLLQRCADDQSKVFEPSGKAITKGQRTYNLEHDPKFSATSLLLEFINKSALRYCTNHPINSQHPFLAQRPDRWRIAAWGSLLFKQGHHSSHIHESGWLSGIYYAKLPHVMETENEKREGWIEFGRPINYVDNENSPEFHFLRPQEGMMVLFPSYYYHQTVPFESDDTRFTVAFDLMPLS